MKKVLFALLLGFSAFMACQKTEEKLIPSKLALISPNGVELAPSIDKLVATMQKHLGEEWGGIQEITQIEYFEANNLSTALVTFKSPDGSTKQVAFQNDPSSTDRYMIFTLIIFCDRTSCSTCEMFVIFTPSSGYSPRCTCCALREVVIEW